MCGLFGWQLSPDAVAAGDTRVLATLLGYQAENRGNESWGVVMLGDEYRVPTILKNIGSIRQTCRVASIVAPQVIGHTRKATTGKISVENAHPFVHGYIVGAHNGWIHDHSELNKEYKRQFEVDSQHLIAHIAEGKSVKDLSGYGTTTYLNTQNPSTVYIGRGQGSDLAVYGIGPDQNKPLGIVWASQGHWIGDALTMAGFRHYFPIRTEIRRLYTVTGYEIFEEGEFDLGYSNRRNSTISRNDVREINQVTHGCYGGHGYRGRTAFDDAAYKQERGAATTVPYDKLPEAEGISKEQLDKLPEHLKKNHEKRDVAEREAAEVAAGYIECAGCKDRGPLVTSFEDDSDGVLYFSGINTPLCLWCASFWSEETGGRVNFPKLNLQLPKGGKHDVTEEIHQ